MMKTCLMYPNTSVRPTVIKLLHFFYRGLKPRQLQCPHCSTVGKFRKIRPYPRMVITADNQKRQESYIMIPRFACAVCGHTHSVRPSFLIPDGSYTRGFVRTVLDMYRQRLYTVRELCEHWQISCSTLYEWLARYGCRSSSDEIG